MSAPADVLLKFSWLKWYFGDAKEAPGNPASRKIGNFRLQYGSKRFVLCCKSTKTLYLDLLFLIIWHDRISRRTLVGE